MGKTRKYMYRNTKNIYSSKKVTHNILVYWQVQVIVAVTSVLCISYVFEYMHRIEILGFLVYFIVFEENMVYFIVFEEKKKMEKNVILEFGNAFSVHFSKLSSRHQAKLINIYENFGVFIFHILPVSMRDMLLICDFMFRKSVSQYFCFQFLTSYSFWYPYVKKLHRVPYLAFRTNFFQKNTNAKTWTTTDRQLRHAHKETS